MQSPVSVKYKLFCARLCGHHEAHPRAFVSSCAGTTPDSGHRQIDQALQHLEAPSSVSPQRASRSANLHNAQHALHRTLTPPQSLERKSSVNSNHQNHAPMEACTMDALAAQHSGSMMSAVRPSFQDLLFCNISSLAVHLSCVFSVRR